MKKSSGFNNTKKLFIVITDVVLFHLSFVLSFLVRYDWNIPQFNYIAYESARPFIFLAFIFLNIMFGNYVMYNKQRTDFVYLTIIVQFFMSILIMAMTFFGRLFTFPRTIILISFIISSVLLTIWRLIVFQLYLKVDGTKNVLVIGDEISCKRAIFNINQAKNNRHKVTAVALDNYFENVQSSINHVDIIYIAKHIDEKVRTEIYELVIRNNKQLFLSTSFENLVLINPNIMNIEDESIIEINEFKISPEEDLIKRIIDFLISLAMIIVTSPIMIITSIIIKLTSKGPILYKQVRITKNQREFNILKFRTMSTTAERDSGPVLASANDTRVTMVGKYLRSLRIDELPQLFNVLKGDMSLVGPRPERPFFVEQFVNENKYYDLRHNIRAGITGFAQVYGKYASDFNSKLNFDLLYIQKYSLLFDVKIMLQTIKILFDKVSSQGVDEEELVNLKTEPLPDDIKILK
ncbi:sugar transferase [Alkalibacterium sp. m-11]|uniref:Sugar transferase n=1 Tax=Alkalibacterium indicireducens TaxID=398758 RepID=A0ABN1AUB8_9LACT